MLPVIKVARSLLGELEMSGRPRVYWDTCIFLAFIKNESRKESNDMQGIHEIVSQIDSGEIILTTSPEFIILVSQRKTIQN